MIPPCGVPLNVLWYRQSSRYPARKNFQMSLIIFSSLITDDLKHKGNSVKADAQMSKPEIENLVNVIDKLTEKIKK